MFCHVCGAKIEEGAESCPCCGTPLKIEAPSFNGMNPPGLKDLANTKEVKNPVICPHCGYKYGAELGMCPRCGMQNCAIPQSLESGGSRFEKYANPAHGRPGGNGFDKYTDADRRPDGSDGFRYDFEKYPMPKSAGSGRFGIGRVVIIAVVLIAIAVVVWRFL